MIALELAGAFLAGLLALPVGLVAWFRYGGGRRWLLQKALGPLAGAMAAAPTVTVTGGQVTNVPGGSIGPYGQGGGAGGGPFGQGGGGAKP